jgi:hypothetical protein
MRDIFSSVCAGVEAPRQVEFGGEHCACSPVREPPPRTGRFEPRQEPPLLRGIGSGLGHGDRLADSLAYLHGILSTGGERGQGLHETLREVSEPQGNTLPRRIMVTRLFRKTLWGPSPPRDSPIGRAAGNEAEDGFAPLRCSPPRPRKTPGLRAMEV